MTMRNGRSQSPDYYRILGISPDVTQDEVREAYRAAAKRWHPDVNPGAEAAERMREVNEAWRVLGDATIRAGYDRARETARAIRSEADGHVDVDGRRTATSQTGTGRPRSRSSVVVGGMLVAAALVGAVGTFTIYAIFPRDPEVVVPTQVVVVVTRVATATPWPTPTAIRTPRPMPTATRTVFQSSKLSPTPIWGVHQSSGYNVELINDVEGQIGCETSATVFSFFQGIVEFDFKVPRETRWSVGVVYHDHWPLNHDTLAILAENRLGQIRVDHHTRTEWDEISRETETIHPSSLYEFGEFYPGRFVRFSLQTNHAGSRIFVDGEPVVFIPYHGLRPKSSSLKICAGFYNGEPQPYSVDVVKWRVGYTKSEAESTALANPSPTSAR